MKEEEEEEEIYDSDDENKESVEKKADSLFRHTKNGPQRVAPASQQLSTTIGLPGLGNAPASHGCNKHYPDVSDFYGDRTKWEAWQMHLDSKFHESAMLFPTERSRINYIRDHCKSTAFDVIKARCLDKTNSYTTAKEILEDLNNMYGEFDVYGTADAELYSPDFGIGI